VNAMEMAPQNIGSMDESTHILVVDDETGPRESLRIILDPYYRVSTASRSEEAVEIMRKRPVDVVTLDLKMPGVSGIKLLEQIRERDPDVEAIIITGYGSLETALEGLRLRAFDYIAKPFDVNQVLALIRRALQSRRARLKLKQIKSEFLSSISHELRTPLSVVMGFSSLLLDQPANEMKPEQLKMLEKVYRSSEEMLGLIDNILWLGNLRSGDLSLMPEEFDLAGVLREGTEKYRSVMEEKGIRLSFRLPDEGVHIRSDLSKVSRVFQNLFQNAVKFTADGEIAVSARWHSAREVVIQIEDTGSGMDDEQLRNAFGPFYRVEESFSSKGPGLRIGLAVARLLSELLGGELEIQSRPGKGTRVSLKLPTLTVLPDAKGSVASQSRKN